MRVAVIGGGIAGLACAWQLARAGDAPVVLEASPQLGGLAATFTHDGVTLDRWYHVLLDSDAALCGLIDALGLADRLHWQRTGMGFHVGGRLYGFNSPLDLLRFGALSLPDRVRTGLGALYLTRGVRAPRALDEVTAAEWLPRVFGARVMTRIWEPLLRAKFGDRHAGVPAYWVWNTLNREKNGAPEVKGYLRGGYALLTARLAEAIADGGGEVRTATPVAGLEADADGVIVHTAAGTASCDAAIVTLPLPLLARVARGPLAAAVPLPALAYQGVVNAVVVMRRQLGPYYWTAVLDPRFRFQGVVETTHVIPPAWVGGRHLAYLMNYCDADSALYRRPDDAVRADALEGLAALYPGFREADVEAVHVFRAPHVEPAWPVGYLRQRPAPRIAGTRCYLCTTAQAYPRVTAWNTSVGLAAETVAALRADLQGASGTRRSAAA